MKALKRGEAYRGCAAPFLQRRRRYSPCEKLCQVCMYVCVGRKVGRYVYM